MSCSYSRHVETDEKMFAFYSLLIIFSYFTVVMVIHFISLLSLENVYDHPYYCGNEKKINLSIRQVFRFSGGTQISCHQDNCTLSIKLSECCGISVRLFELRFRHLLQLHFEMVARSKKEYFVRHLSALLLSVCAVPCLNSLQDL